MPDENERLEEFRRSMWPMRDVTVTGDAQTPTVRIQTADGNTVLTISHDDADVLAKAGQRAVDALLRLTNGHRT